MLSDLIGHNIRIDKAGLSRLIRHNIRFDTPNPFLITHDSFLIRH
jgi:hypothetical protein